MAYMQRVAYVIVALGLIGSILLVPADEAAAHVTYVVQPGDTLSTIAEEHGLSTSVLAAANGITNHHLIRVGQRLSIPGVEPVFHTIVGGDTLGGIAGRYGVPVADIVALNDLSDPNRIRIGSKIRLPARAGAGSTLADMAARYPALPRSVEDNPDRLGLVPSFERWSEHYGVPTDLLMALAYQESGWQSDVVSHKDAIGVGQLLPSTASWVAADLIGLPDLDPSVADDNIRMSARFVRWLIGFHGSEAEALAGYYQGPTSVRALGQFQETRDYVSNVTSARSRFQRS